MTAPGTDPFASGEQRVEGEKVPALRTLKDRLLVLIPKPAPMPGVNPKVVPNPLNAGTTQNRLTCDIIVCDGPAIAYGGNPRKYEPDTLSMQVPCVIKGSWVHSDVIIEWVLDAITKGPAPLGRLRMNQAKNSENTYWSMEKFTDQDKAIALPLYQAYLANSAFSTATPALAPAQSPMGPMGGYAAPVNPVQPQWPTAQPVATAAPAWPGMQLPPAPAQVTDWTLGAMPAEFPPGPQAWAAASVQDRTGFLAQLGITGPVSMQPTGL